MTKAQNVNAEKTLEMIVKKVKKYLPDFDKEKFSKAYEFAQRAHKGQLRKDNKTPYILHPLKSAHILTNLHVDEDTLIAAMLHDVPEDTEKSLRDIETQFGKKIAFLVNGITKLSKVYYRHDMAERQIESLKKLLIHSAKDPRVILIKLADRLHNMTTLKNVKPEKRVRIAKETLEIYVPIANLLGIEEIKKKLEDECFKHLFQKEYEKIEKILNDTRIRQENILNETKRLIKKELKKESVQNYEIYGREKSRYSAFKKSLRKNKSAEELEDLLAIRIIVNNIKECYLVLGIIHSLFKPKPGRFKDYIAVAKANGYQSLHTVVFGVRGQTTEFQIRTEQMHVEAQYGIAAHYFYKDAHLEGDFNEKHSKWAQKILEYQKANYDSEHFLEALKIDIFQDRIFTFTPKGDTIDLPKGATAVDFAYSIHTEVGDNAQKAVKNGQIIPLTTILKTGDVVNIITSDQPTGPNREWLIFAKTNLAKNKIREALRKNSRRKKLSIGRRLLQKEFDRAGVGLIEKTPRKKIRQIISRYKNEFKTTNFEDILVRIGEGSINPLEILTKIYPSETLIREKKMSFFRRLFHQKALNKKQVSLRIKAMDRIGAGRDLLAILSDNDINVISLKIAPRKFQNKFTMILNLEMESYEKFSYLCEQLEQVDEIIEVSRSMNRNKKIFWGLAAFTLAIWVMHPFVTYYFAINKISSIPQKIALYGGLVMLIFLVYMIKKISNKSFPELRDSGSKKLWVITFLIGNFALLMLIAEIYFYKIPSNWFLITALIVFIYAYIISEYYSYKKQN